MTVARRLGAAGALVVLLLVAALWMLFVVSVSPGAGILSTLRIDLLDHEDAFCINDAGHWLQIVPGLAGLVAAVLTGRALWHRALGRPSPRPTSPAVAFAGLLIAWVMVYTFVGDCGFGGDD